MLRPTASALPLGDSFLMPYRESPRGFDIPSESIAIGRLTRNQRRRSAPLAFEIEQNRGVDAKNYQLK
ncbi:hypothetical protein C1881_03480 [Slackia isoflavoniconvertens]|uniref:Uncharacterized protein n=1 Tax=Slackia isoflavoniconvertens TaxID=572010 RepID=A0A369LND2_9ACTN|nr:hypothetical protein C1881_03480 [Slackia isoflavoniconvertens]